MIRMFEKKMEKKSFIEIYEVFLSICHSVKIVNLHYSVHFRENIK